MMSALSVPSCSPRALCCMLILATAWVGPLLWILFVQEHRSVSHYVQAKCTVSKAKARTERVGGTNRYVGTWNVYWVGPDLVLRTGEIYGQTGDGSLIFTYGTENKAKAELDQHPVGASDDCVYDGRVLATGGDATEAKKGWVRWGKPETTEAVLGSWALGVSVGWFGLGLGWCVLRALEKRYECSTAAEYWGVGILCCIHKRSSERQILMEDLEGEGSCAIDRDDRNSGQGGQYSP